MRDIVARMADGKLFHTHGAATGNARLPKVDGRVCATEQTADEITHNILMKSHNSTF